MRPVVVGLFEEAQMLILDDDDGLEHDSSRELLFLVKGIFGNGI